MNSARLVSGTTLRPAATRGPGPQPAWASGPRTAAQCNSRARDGLSWGVLSGWHGGGKKTAPVGEVRGDHTDGCGHTHGDSCLFFLSLGRWLSGQPEPRQVGLPPGDEASPRPGAGPPAQQRLGGTFHVANPHTRRTDVSSRGEAVPFCFLSGGKPPSQGQAVGAPLWHAPSEPPTPGHMTWVLLARATAEGTILPHFLSKVTLGAGARPPAAPGAEAGSRNRAVSGSRNSAPGPPGDPRPGAPNPATKHTSDRGYEKGWGEGARARSERHCSEN